MMGVDDGHLYIAAVEFHDSVVAAVYHEGAIITIDFSPAYVHRSEGTPDIARGTGWAQRALMTLSGYHISGELPKLPCSLSGGTVELGSEVYNNLIPVPFNFTGVVRVTLSFADDSCIDLSACELAIDVFGDATYIEELPWNHLKKE
jgi:hypothetical protein